jgi:large subunit ribosomal protein L22
MEAKAVTKFIHFSPHKAREIVDLIRGKTAEQALSAITFSNKKAAKIVGKTLKSAIANAQTNHSMNLDALYVEKAFVDKGPIWSRFMPRAMGRATPLRKPTAHITIVLKESEELLKQIQAVQTETAKAKGKKGKVEEAKAEPKTAPQAKKEDQKEEKK